MKRSLRIDDLQKLKEHFKIPKPKKQEEEKQEKDFIDILIEDSEKGADGKGTQR